MAPKEVDAVLANVTDTVTSTVASGEVVTIAGFAKFAKVERAARMGRNPATGETIRIKASKKARITPLKAFKDAVMAPARGRAGGGAKKAAPAKKAPAKKTAAKKAPAKKATAAKKR
jgi:DNA-binding protein HU-beta